MFEPVDVVVGEGGQGGAVVVVVTGCLLEFVLDGGEVLAAREDDDGGMGVPDGEVLEELVDGVEVVFGSFPEFAFGDE